MNVRRYESPGNCYNIREYHLAEDCLGQEVSDNVLASGVAPSTRHELWDGRRWFTVHPGVFALWLRSCEIVAGKKWE